MKKTLLLPLFGVCTLLSSSISIAAEELTPIPKASSEWRFEVTPYLWAPGIKATLNLGNGLAKSADYSSSNVLDNLKSGGMISAEAHKGQWGMMGDVVSATLQNSGAIPVQGGTATLGDKITLQQTVLTGAVTYTIANTKDAYMDGLLGARAIYATATLNVTGVGTAAKTTSTVDPVVGMKGRYRIADSTWYVPFYGDIGSGGGTTNLTWQAMLGVGKTFSNLIDASLTYRALYYDMKDGGVLQKTTMQGPQVAVTFKF
ncbi:hypothetical protein CBI30_10005 [Polynucleobacter aenigmaticus]|uniref:Outer membrane protein beta-barrel domain-containing protein n=1 Tax=Polynucleobacter aenigmaticus TaxID=1743164 RepID=A0A254PXV9_9BURK|nr:hypothetical protein [Polynucleobacter aenigmaticus]OWS69391.1 hypothetical protein CBI30_10005 [Polynucleobacter aenigmaticus]